MSSKPRLQITSSLNTHFCNFSVFRMDYDSDENEMLESGVVDVGEKGGLSSCGYW